MTNANNNPDHRGNPAGGRCPCYGQIPTVSRPEGTKCLNEPLATSPSGLCGYHQEMFDGIDRRACQGIRNDMAQAGLASGYADGVDLDDEG